jgi:diguanylate cyclase (GGDEF)-like protein
MLKLLAHIAHKPKIFHILLGVVLSCVIGLFDYYTGYEISISIFYIIPVSLLAWYVGKIGAVLCSMFCVGIWISGDLLAGLPYGNPFVVAWNTLTSLLILLIISYFLSLIKKMYDRERMSARIDPLTCISNRKYFYEAVGYELHRAARFTSPVSLVFFDIDNFKKVNDSLGHDEGDRLLVSFAATVKANIRSFDVIARFGGDEFVLFMPSTDMDQGRTAVEKLRGLFDAVARENSWPVSLSVGVVTATGRGTDIDALVNYADNLMYEVKKSGKNMIRCAMFQG